MKRLTFILVLISIFQIAHTQNIVYDENAEVRNVAVFSGIEVSGTVSLYLSQGPVAGLAISAGDAKYNSKIKTEVRDGILHISIDGGMWNGFNWSDRKLKAYVTVSTLNSIEASGATYVSMTGTIKSSNLRIDVSGASEIKGDLATERLAIDLSGASVARLSGTARSTSIDASGACTINSYRLSTDSCKATASGASGIRISVKDQLTADGSGGSSIFYKGAPQTVNANSSAGSAIKNKSGED